MKQEWVCEGCGLSGAVDYEPTNGDVFSVVHAIEDHHNRLAERHASHCRFDVHKVRVRNPSLMDEFAWNRFVASVTR
jgi:hypothetical protein